LYHWILPRTLKEEDPYRYYQPSSPYSADFAYPNDDFTGDQHPWNVGFGDFDFFKYRTYECRFPNEGGLRGPGSLPAVSACLEEGEKYMHSFSWQLHENSIDDWGSGNSADLMVGQWLGIDALSVDLETYVYLGGFVQGEGLTEYILNFRRRKFDSGSAIFWMYNDCWPATRSWTIVDYYKNRTPAFYPVKRAFNPIAADIVCQEGKLSVYAVSDKPEDAEALLEYGIFTSEGEYIEKRSKKIAIKANRSEAVAEIDYGLWQKTGETKSFPYALIYIGEKIVSSRRFINKRHYELELVKTPAISLRKGDKTGKA
jgi:beta-mannosidase